MDSGANARPPTGRAPSTYHPVASDVGVAPTQSAFATSPVADMDTWSNPHLGSQSRNNLRQASVALDTAYERITSLRNSINNMLNRIPPEVAGTGASASASTDTTPGDAQPRHSLGHDPSIRPPHSALVLSGEQVVEELNLRVARLRSLISPTTRQRLEEFESNSRGNATWDRFSQSDPPRVDGSDVRPALPRPHTPPTLDAFSTSGQGLQNVHQDDSSTMIGRRVAARVNAADGRVSLSSRLTLSEFERRLQAQTVEVARELESMTERLTAQRSRRVELASSRTRTDNAVSVVQENVAPAPSTASGDLRSAPSPPAGGRPLRPTRDVTLVNNSARIVLPQPISRTLSDGTPLDELSAVSRRGLSAASREHSATHRDHVQTTNRSQDTPRNLIDVPEVRGTLVNLLMRDREDQTRQTEYARPGVENSRRGDTSIRSDTSSAAGGEQGRRRRGWTRLNADGDAIDSDEDEDVSPQTRRLRMRFTYGAVNASQPTTRSHTVTIEDILWRTSGSDSEVDALSPDASDNIQSHFRNLPPRPAMRHPHPLPTPVEDMVVYPATKAPPRPQVICVSKYASLAGR